jgi:hypothetical protein
MNTYLKLLPVSLTNSLLPAAILFPSEDTNQGLAVLVLMRLAEALRLVVLTALLVELLLWDVFVIFLISLKLTARLLSVALR